MPTKKTKIRSPRAPAYLKKPVIISSPQRRKLKRLPKKDLQHLSFLAGEPLEKKDTKSIITHRLSRNQKIALGLGASSSIPLLYWALRGKKNTKLKNPKKTPLSSMPENEKGAELSNKISELKEAIRLLEEQFSNAKTAILSRNGNHDEEIAELLDKMYNEKVFVYSKSSISAP